MPAKHKYKCLNPNCKGTGRKDDTGLFVAMNSPSPACPCCGAMKVEDWGDAPHESIGPVRSRPASFGKSGAAARIDDTQRGLAEAYGMSDIKSGAAPQRSSQPAPARGEFGNKNYFGVDCPIGRTSVTVSSNAGIPIKTAANARIPGDRAVPSHMRQISASHKG